MARLAGWLFTSRPQSAVFVPILTHRAEKRLGVSVLLMMDARQLAELVDAHAPALLLFARQFCTTPEDAVQQAFVKLVAGREPPHDVLAWLYRTVRNAAIDLSRSDRRRQRRETHVARPEAWFIEPDLERADAEIAVAALALLPLEQREIVIARIWGNMTFEQLAAVFSISVSSAYRRYETGIGTLAEHLGVQQ